MENLINTYLDKSLSYKLSYSEEEEGEYTEIISKSNIPTSEVAVKRPLASEISVPANSIYYYNLDITLNDLLDIDQIQDLNAVFSTKFDIGQSRKYRYYNLSIDPNEGMWNSFTGVQEYKLKNNETMEIPNPERVGYDFTGWDINGVSYELNNKTFSMGISDTILTAKWTPKKIRVTIDGEQREVDFDTIIDLGMPKEKEGFTFTGWNTTGGIIKDNTLQITSENDITVTPTYTINNYKYIVYHSKMNLDGKGYTLISADTDERESAFGSTINPNPKTYQGFTSPTLKSLTIQVENEYPPVKNKVEYNYNRNRYSLTINPNGGTYVGVTEETLYYEETKELANPIKEGYNFTNWTVTGGTINERTITMNASDATATANYTPKLYSITFNPNGGTVSKESKTVYYDATYGELPTPEYFGYDFLGWFTDSAAGEQVTASNTVKLSSNITLFAHWKRTSVMVTLDAGEGSFDAEGTIKTKTIYVELNQHYGNNLIIPYNRFGELITTGIYNFNTWSSTIHTNGSYEQVTKDTIVTNPSVHTLYAVWQGGCFLADTLIYTPSGFIKIQDIKEGTSVYSYNEATKKIEVDEVVYSIKHSFNSIHDIYLENGTQMHITKDHLVYDPVNKVWKEIGKFNVGDFVQDDQENKFRISNILVGTKNLTFIILK